MARGSSVKRRQPTGTWAALQSEHISSTVTIDNLLWLLVTATSVETWLTCPILNIY